MIYGTMEDTHRGLYRHFELPNHKAPHQALGYRTPAKVYADRPFPLSPLDAGSHLEFGYHLS